MKETFVLIGDYGSGKSELALNIVMNARKAGKSCVLVDLDIINPYFRSSDDAQLLAENDIRVIKPIYAGTGVEGLSLPPDVISVFIDSTEVVVFDVGGDSTGATALGQYKQHFDELEGVNVLLVTNPFRPLSSTPELIMELAEGIEQRGRQKVTGLINNSNLSNETTVRELIAGREIIASVCKQAGLTVAYTAGEEKALSEFMKYASDNSLDAATIGEPLVIKRYMKRDWDRFVGDEK